MNVKTNIAILWTNSVSEITRIFILRVLCSLYNEWIGTVHEMILYDAIFGGNVKFEDKNLETTGKNIICWSSKETGNSGKGYSALFKQYKRYDSTTLTDRPIMKTETRIEGLKNWILSTDKMLTMEGRMRKMKQYKVQGWFLPAMARDRCFFSSLSLSLPFFFFLARKTSSTVHSLSILWEAVRWNTKQSVNRHLENRRGLIGHAHSRVTQTRPMFRRFLRVKIPTKV